MNIPIDEDEEDFDTDQPKCIKEFYDKQDLNLSEILNINQINLNKEKNIYSIVNEIIKNNIKINLIKVTDISNISSEKNNLKLK
jgi:hypothetical protein